MIEESGVRIVQLRNLKKHQKVHPDKNQLPRKYRAGLEEDANLLRIIAAQTVKLLLFLLEANWKKDRKVGGTVQESARTFEAKLIYFCMLSRDHSAVMGQPWQKMEKRFVEESACQKQRPSGASRRAWNAAKWRHVPFSLFFAVFLCFFHLLLSCHFMFVFLKFWAKFPWHHSFAHVARGYSEMHLFKCWL